MKSATIFMLFMTFSISTFANEKRDLVLQMFQITNAKENHNLMVESYVQQFKKDPVLRDKRFENYLREAMAWDALINPISKIYEESYTVDELKSLNDFYKSKAGQAFIKKAPAVNDKMTKVFADNISKARKHIE